MPANLPPHYFEVEKKLKTATTPQEKVAIMEELLSIIPRNRKLTYDARKLVRLVFDQGSLFEIGRYQGRSIVSMDSWILLILRLFSLILISSPGLTR